MTQQTMTGPSGTVYGILDAEVAEHILHVAGDRIFVDMDIFLAMMHGQLHDLLPEVVATQGPSTALGMHTYAEALDNVARATFHDAGLVHPFDSEPVDGAPSEDGPSVEELLSMLAGNPWNPENPEA